MDYSTNLILRVDWLDYILKMMSHIFVQCGLGGCLTELCIQLAIIMVGKQVFNAVLEIVHP